MNLPNINNKMKNSNNLNHNIKNNQNNNFNSLDGFGLGIQVFKIESKKNIETNSNNPKSKNRNMMKNIQNPNQTYSYKQGNVNYIPNIPKPKILPSLQKSNSTLSKKQRTSGLIYNQKNNLKENGNLMSDYSDKILQRKGLNTNMSQNQKSLTPNSRSMKKRTTLSLQKPSSLKNQSNSIKEQIVRNVNNKTSILTQIKQKPVMSSNNTKNLKLNNAQTQLNNKNQQGTIQYIDYHSQHMQIIKFYSNYVKAQTQNIKQIKQLKRIRQNQENQEIYDHIQYLQSSEGIVGTIVDNLQKQNYQIKLQKNQEIKGKKKNNNQLNQNFIIVPVTGFQSSQYQNIQFFGILDYQNKSNFRGQFKINNYQNIDLAPISHTEEEQIKQKNQAKRIN